MSVGDIVSVSQLTRYIKGLMEHDHILTDVWIRGEISNFKLHSRGHMYFTIKDQNSRIQAVMFAGHNRYLAFKPENGMKVLIRGEVNVYEPYGQYQLYAKEMQPDGVGSLFLAYEKLKETLQEEGLFDESRKRPIPRFPKKIAIVTSPTGAAIKDMLATLKRRYPLAQITLLPVLVQGQEAPASIVRAVNQANAANQFDTLIVGRGGGSIEELWAFNDEGVARCIAASTVPVISAVGHETDFTISDFVADLRAPTPTGAAELAVPDVAELLHSRQVLHNRLKRQMKLKIEEHQEQLKRLKRSYAFRYPLQLIRQKEQELDTQLERLQRASKRHMSDKQQQFQLIEKALQRLHPKGQIKDAQSGLKDKKLRLEKSMTQHLSRHEQRFNHVVSELNLLSPLRIMERGYSLAYTEGKEELVKSIQQVDAGQKVEVRVTDGVIYCQVEDKQSKHS
ncbi:exodeoxyribonuclease VII large subunit [Alkalihalophilus pseudofirmus]|uniref:exodeoxyribonuclease VII large subunit n=1 Tax=Alkalihalophilus pseudofirmus TaxID=79885 RepID=UPI00259B16D5|nr:exodeoxyribonuclease VII large subunit [Alkalihalophilus pseudofirmus]WEG15872.1 exodeoxyribonuclease VII large subunit [Alkalihalophilus pseudofirmus]